ncbi:MAG TPA: ABC transporter permease [Dehalococcoidia bacterium]|nr:ABC transporter permease [Dehalococcoidia bacterium]
MAGALTAARGRAPSAAPRVLFLATLWCLGGLLVAFIMLPLVRLTLATSPGELVDAGQRSDVRAAIRLSLQDAAVTAVVAAFLGVPLAFILSRSVFPGQRFVEAIVDLPLAVPHSVVGIALLFVFGRRGWIGAPADHIGISFFGTQWGIVAGMLFVSAPFMVGSVRVALDAIDPRIERAARSLGATRAYAFRRVTLPLAARGIMTGLVLTYARSISEFGAIVILAYYPMTAPVKAYDLYLQNGLDASAAVSVLLLIVTLSTFVVFRALASGQVRPLALR